LVLMEDSSGTELYDILASRKAEEAGLIIVYYLFLVSTLPICLLSEKT